MEDNEYEWRDFVLYMTIHATLAMSSIFLLALPCFTYKKFHQTMLVVLVVLCVHRGSKRYTYYVSQNRHGNRVVYCNGDSDSLSLLFIKSFLPDYRHVWKTDS